MYLARPSAIQLSTRSCRCSSVVCAPPIQATRAARSRAPSGSGCSASLHPCSGQYFRRNTLPSRAMTCASTNRRQAGQRLRLASRKRWGATVFSVVERLRSSDVTPPAPILPWNAHEDVMRHTSAGGAATLAHSLGRGKRPVRGLSNDDAHAVHRQLPRVMRASLSMAVKLGKPARKHTKEAPGSIPS
jgi:hypothetical protein